MKVGFLKPKFKFGIDIIWQFYCCFIMSVLSYYNRGDIMNFSDKLVFLLSVTHTSNIKLAKAINVDPSMISRLRKGRRNIRGISII